MSPILQAARAGLVEVASGGTLFLDEAGDIPLPMQVKLLRLLESGTYRRVGSTELRRADVRVVSATHRDLGAPIGQGRFREDLYYRLATCPIPLPPLRGRLEDIPLLATALLERIAPRGGLSVAPAALQRLLAHPYPGNVRELRNVLERAALLTDGPEVGADGVEQALALGALRVPATTTLAGNATPAAPRPAPDAMQAAQREALRAALASHRGSRRELAASLGLSVRTLYRKLRELGVGD